MTERVSTMDVRQRIGDLLNRVALRHDEFIIERKGKALAALVPVEQMRRAARHGLREWLERQKASEHLSDKEAMDLALAAQRSARKRRGTAGGRKRARK